MNELMDNKNEEEAHEQVRIKYRGSCPSYKGHFDGDFVSGIYAGVFTSTAFWIILFIIIGSIKGWR